MKFSQAEAILFLLHEVNYKNYVLHLHNGVAWNGHKFGNICSGRQGEDLC